MDIQPDMCIICLENITDDDVIWTCSDCNLQLHKDCFDTWKINRNVCPHCNTIQYNAIIEERNNIVVSKRTGVFKLKIFCFMTWVFITLFCSGLLCSIVISEIINIYTVYNTSF